MRILLVHPEYPATFWSFKHALRFIAKKAAYPPLGLITVAAMLPREWEIRLVDLNIEKLMDKDLEWADLIMISAMLVQKNSVQEVLSRCQGFKAKTIAGGPLFSSVCLDDFPVDHYILGEAEISLPLFLADLERGTTQKVYRAEGYPDLVQTPVPRWDIVKLRKYATLMIQCSRGCPFNCDFCDITNLFGRVPRLKRAEQILEELTAIYELGWRDTVFFVDDNFIGNKKAIKEMLPQLMDWMAAHNHPFTFVTEASINLADDDELIELMVKASFNRVFIGLETPNEASLRECEKNQNCSRDLTASIHKLQMAGLQVFGGYIVGFDNDDESIFSRQIKFIQESGVVTAMVGLLNAMPNTKLWHKLAAENRLLSHIPATGDNTDGTINFVPRMELDKLVEGYRRVVKTIYSPRAFYQRVISFLERYQPRAKKRFHGYEVRAFINSIWRLGILGNGVSQWYFWKLLFKALIRYRSAFPEAMTLMIFGHHFRRISKKV